jgi:glucose-fructose oxidoreductase
VAPKAVVRKESQQAKQLDDDTDALMKGLSLIAPGEEGLRDIRVVEAVYKSVANGGKRIVI